MPAQRRFANQPRKPGPVDGVAQSREFPVMSRQFTPQRSERRNTKPKTSLAQLRKLSIGLFSLGLGRM